MRWAREHDDLSAAGRQAPYTSMREMRGATERDRENRQSKQQQDFRRVLREVAVIVSTRRLQRALKTFAVLRFQRQISGLMP